MPQNVLLPMDLQQPQSWDATAGAVHQQVDRGGTLHLLGVVPDVGRSMASTFLPEGYKKQFMQVMKQGLDKFAAALQCQDMNVQTYVAHGHVADAILNGANDVGADLIVLGSPRCNKSRSILICSHTNAVVRHSTCSVLVVR